MRSADRIVDRTVATECDIADLDTEWGDPRLVAGAAVPMASTFTLEGLPFHGVGKNDTQLSLSSPRRRWRRSDISVHGTA
jgi:hypothetical protein